MNMKRIASTFLIFPCICVVVIKGAIECTPSINKCACNTSNFTLDLSFAFPNGYVNITDPRNEGSSVVISPCKDYYCGGRPSRGCQWDASGNTFIILGKATDVVWVVTSQTDFTVTFSGGDKTFDDRVREARIKSMIIDKDTPSVTYDGESGSSAPDPLVFLFTVGAKSFIHCRGGPANEDITGMVVIVIVTQLIVVGVVSLLVIGGYAMREARRVEVDSNYSVWRQSGRKGCVYHEVCVPDVTKPVS